jgi:hypothetical protein
MIIAIPFLLSLLRPRADNFLFIRLNLLQPLIVIEFPSTEAYSSLDLTNVKYSIIKLPKVEKKNVIL